MKGLVFDIKEFAIHDGPGCRVTVFLQGCPLRCRWCHNPEGFEKRQRLLLKKGKCVGCGKCIGAADHEPCASFGRCAHRCPNGALSVCGEEWDAAALAAHLKSYARILRDMDGGYTLSGGEPLFQPEFTLELLRGLRGEHRCIETSGFAPEEVFREALRELEFVIMDLKLADPERHREMTGATNEPILRNFEILRSSGLPHLVRVPLIPGITDTPENLSAISRIAGDSPIERIPNNLLAGAKYDSLVA